MRCDLLLLTEVSERVEIPEFTLHKTQASMAARRRWAAVASRQPLTPLPDPHGATAMVEVHGLRVCSSILPWRACGTRNPWVGATTAAKTATAVAAIEAAGPTVWGGDWNHALSGQEWTGSQEGRGYILDGVGRLALQVPTAAAPHRIDGLLSIDHIAIPAEWTVHTVEHHPGSYDDVNLSDHDAYVIEISR